MSRRIAVPSLTGVEAAAAHELTHLGLDRVEGAAHRAEHCPPSRPGLLCGADGKQRPPPLSGDENKLWTAGPGESAARHGRLTLGDEQYDAGRPVRDFGVIDTNSDNRRIVGHEDDQSRRGAHTAQQVRARGRQDARTSHDHEERRVRSGAHQRRGPGSLGGLDAPSSEDVAPIFHEHRLRCLAPGGARRAGADLRPAATPARPRPKAPPSAPGPDRRALRCEAATPARKSSLP